MIKNEILYKLKYAVDALAVPLFHWRGRSPWTLGYFTEKRRAITSAIDTGAIKAGAPLPAGYGVGIDDRVIEYPWLFDQLRRLPKTGEWLDAGSALNHEFLLQREPLKGANLTIMTLAPEKRCHWYSGFSYVFGDFRKTYFQSQAFDVVCCISTIEHVGLDNTMLYTGDQALAENDERGFVAAVKEFKRITKPGGTCFISFPYGRRANMGWYQVFDAEMVAAIIEAFGAETSSVEYFAYRKDGWRRAEANEVADADTYDVHSGRGKGTDGAASARAIACVRLVA